MKHVASNASANKAWHPSWSHLVDLVSFIGVESILLNPVFFIAVTWACIAFWRRMRHDPRLVYVFSMGAPLFLIYLVFSLHSPILPNWIAPAVLPLLCVAAIYWDTRWRLGVRAIKGWLAAGLAIGFVAVAFLHETDLVQHIVGRPLPPKIDPLTRVRGYHEMAAMVEDLREKLQAEGKPAFIICAHYGSTGHLSFYIPEARTNVATEPFVYYQTSTNAINQFYFWPGYKETRAGQNALYIHETGMPRLVKGWPLRWLKGEPLESLSRELPDPKPVPDVIRDEFDSVKLLGVYPVYYRGRLFHNIEVFECRNLH